MASAELAGYLAAEGFRAALEAELGAGVHNRHDFTWVRPWPSDRETNGATATG